MTISSDTIHRLSSDVLQEFQALGHYSEKVPDSKTPLFRRGAAMGHIGVPPRGVARDPPRACPADSERPSAGHAPLAYRVRATSGSRATPPVCHARAISGSLAAAVTLPLIGPRP
jgi:hypothetical protein